MSFTLCERLGPVRSETKERFLMKAKNKLPQGTVIDVGKNFFVQENGNDHQYKIILIGTQKVVTDGLIQKRVDLEMAKKLAGEVQQGPPVPKAKNSKRKKTDVPTSRILSRLDSYDSDSSTGSDISSTFSFHPRANSRHKNTILSDIDEEMSNENQSGDENFVPQQPIGSRPPNINTNDDNNNNNNTNDDVDDTGKSQSQSLLSNDDYLANYRQHEETLARISAQKLTESNISAHHSRTAANTVQSAKDGTTTGIPMRPFATSFQGNSASAVQNTIAKNINNQNTNVRTPSLNASLLPTTSNTSLTNMMSTVNRPSVPSTVTNSLIQNENRNLQDDVYDYSEHATSTPSIPIVRSQAYKECRAENVSHKRKISELEDELKTLRQNQGLPNDEIRQIMNTIVKPMADQIGNILSILKKAHPLYARDYDEEHDGEVLFYTQPEYHLKNIFVGNGLYISCLDYNIINFGDPLKASQDLAICLFGKQILSTHSVSGRASNAHLQTKAAKPQLDKDKMTVIIEHIKTKYQEIKGNLSFYDNHAKCVRDLLDADITRAIANKCASLSRPATDRIVDQQ